MWKIYCPDYHFYITGPPGVVIGILLQMADLDGPRLEKVIYVQRFKAAR